MVLCVFLASEATQGKSRKEERILCRFRRKQPKSSLHSTVRLRANAFLHTQEGGLRSNRLCLARLFPGRSWSLLLYSTKLPLPLNCQNRKTCCDLWFFFFLRDCLPPLALFQPSCLWFREMPHSCCQAIPPCFPPPLETYSDGSLPGTDDQSCCVSPTREHPLFDPSVFPYGCINFQSSLVQNKTTSQPNNLRS